MRKKRSDPLRAFIKAMEILDKICLANIFICIGAWTLAGMLAISSPDILNGTKWEGDLRFFSSDGFLALYISCLIIPFCVAIFTKLFIRQKELGGLFVLVGIALAATQTGWIVNKNSMTACVILGVIDFFARMLRLPTVTSEIRKIFERRRRSMYRIWLKKEKRWADEEFRLIPEGKAVRISPDGEEILKKDSYEIQICTGKQDFEGNDLYAGDVIKSLVGGQLIEIRYGAHDSFCPADQSVMDNVGFYAVSNGYPIMPIGNTEDYAIRIGNVLENPELRQKGGSRWEKTKSSF